MKFSVIGAGGWGTTLAIILNEKGHNVILYEYFSDYCKVLNEKRENIKFLKGIKIPENIKIINDLKAAIENSEYIILATPSHVLRKFLKKIKKFNYKQKVFISVVKGIEQKTLMTMSEIIKQELGNVKIVVLSGPSLAPEVARKIPTTVVAASEDLKFAEKVQQMLSTNYFRIYTNNDVKGVELGGSLKNVIAIAAGILDGIKTGDNTKAALITRGLAEIKRLGVKMGAHNDTFYGLSGLGDLVVTCEGKLSRNRTVGEQLGKGKKLKEILKNMEMVAEGVKTAYSAYKLSKKYDIEMPITKEVYEVIYKNKSPLKSIADLMSRTLKSEKEFLIKK
jgi:glycerol-3-phosphate dehydrogenase (NAD(P)+)